jgi:hypothetical protein
VPSASENETVNVAEDCPMKDHGKQRLASSTVHTQNMQLDVHVLLTIRI